MKENDNSDKSTNLNVRNKDMPFQISNVLILLLILFSNLFLFNLLNNKR